MAAKVNGIARPVGGVGKIFGEMARGLAPEHQDDDNDQEDETDSAATDPDDASKHRRKKEVHSLPFILEGSSFALVF